MAILLKGLNFYLGLVFGTGEWQTVHFYTGFLKLGKLFNMEPSYLWNSKLCLIA
jgi:hypothetical protein